MALCVSRMLVQDGSDRIDRLEEVGCTIVYNESIERRLHPILTFVYKPLKAKVTNVSRPRPIGRLDDAEMLHDTWIQRLFRQPPIPCITSDNHIARELERRLSEKAMEPLQLAVRKDYALGAATVSGHLAKARRDEQMAMRKPFMNIRY